MASLYLHIPFCKQRCIYCDFYFVTTHRSTRPFIDALLTEISLQGQAYGQEEAIETIYFGGGTPSQLSIEEIDLILKAIHSHFNMSDVDEISFELNPDDVDVTYLKALRQTGVNRLSIGIQSFSEADLRWMNRAHTSEQAMHIVDHSRQAGFSNFSIDLIFGLPTQTLQEWNETLQRVQNIKPPHISTYSLTVETGTPLYKRIQNNVDTAPREENQAALYQATMQALTHMGYEHYEVSSFALDGFRSQHNQAYWTHKNYLGFGPSAHSFWRQDDLHGNRWKNVSNLKKYIHHLQEEALPHSDTEPISKNELLDEYIMLRLRTLDGLDLDHIQRQFKLDFIGQKKEQIDQLLIANHIAISESNRLHLTENGFMVCDAVIGELLI
ncbi:MAG: radical SAM family heme chaperone HemW [Rhodothermaceae bacterium]|nr:radical SAM family heme chaperone HemW [Rhodothermaceae bacterium]